MEQSNRRYDVGLQVSGVESGTGHTDASMHAYGDGYKNSLSLSAKHQAVLHGTCARNS